MAAVARVVWAKIHSGGRGRASASVVQRRAVRIHNNARGVVERDRRLLAGPCRGFPAPPRYRPDSACRIGLTRVWLGVARGSLRAGLNARHCPHIHLGSPRAPLRALRRGERGRFRVRGELFEYCALEPVHLALAGVPLATQESQSSCAHTRDAFSPSKNTRCCISPRFAHYAQRRSPPCLTVP